MIEKPASTAKLMISNFVRNTTGMIGLFIVFLVITSSIFAVQISGYDPNLFDIANTSQAPTAQHLMGTDQLGRDMFSRVLYGGRNSILIGVLASFFGNLIGTVLGAIAGYIGGKFDTIFIRISELVMTFPQLVLVLIFVTFLGQGVSNVILIFAITGWMTTFRLVRSEFMSLREEAFVEAERQTEAERVANDPNAILLERLINNTADFRPNERYSNIKDVVAPHRKEGYPLFAMDPRLLTDAQKKKFAKEPGLKSAKHL